MRPARALAAAPVLLAFLAGPRPASAVGLLRVNVEPYQAKVGRLFRASPVPVKVVFRDERPPDPLLAYGTGGPGTLIGIYPKRAASVPPILEGAVREAAAVMGVAPGEKEGATLEVNLKVLRVDVAWALLSTVNCIAYGVVETVFHPAGGGEAVRVLHHPAAFESAGGDPDKVVARMLTRPLWEATAEGLRDALHAEPDADAVARLRAALVKSRDDDEKGDMAFWLGYAGVKDPAAAEALFAVFRTAEGQNVYESAAVALAQLGAPGAKEEFEALLSGAKKLKEWDPRDDAEEAWHLLRGLALLGEKDLAPKIPPVKRYRRKLTDLLAFVDTGKVPETDPTDAEVVAKAREKAAKKTK